MANGFVRVMYLAGICFSSASILFNGSTTLPHHLFRGVVLLEGKEINGEGINGKQMNGEGINGKQMNGEGINGK